MDRDQMITSITQHPGWCGASADFLRREASYEEIEDLYKEMLDYDVENGYEEGGVCV